MRRVLTLVMLLGVTACQDKYTEMQQQAAASASAAAAASAAALKNALAAASASAAATTVRKEEPPPEWITGQQVLIAYKGAAKCPKTVTRNKEDARKLAGEVRAHALEGKMDFSDIAALYSDDPNGKERQGSLGKIKRDSVVKEFSDAAFALHVDEISPVVETQFGFHVIKRNQ